MVNSQRPSRLPPLPLLSLNSVQCVIYAALFSTLLPQPHIFHPAQHTICMHHAQSSPHSSAHENALHLVGFDNRINSDKLSHSISKKSHTGFFPFISVPAFSPSLVYYSLHSVDVFSNTPPHHCPSCHSIWHNTEHPINTKEISD